jgi:hypothetical protein
MGNGNIDRKRTAPDPGNLLFVLYVGFVMCIIFLAMVMDGCASGDHGVRRDMSISEIRQGTLLFSAPGEDGNCLPAGHRDTSLQDLLRMIG